MTTPELPVLVRTWITSARWGLLDALVALKLAEEDRQDEAKRQLVIRLQSVNELAADPNREDYIPTGGRTA